MNYAYLNEARDVLLVDTVEWEIEDIQQRIPEVTTRVDGAPDGLLARMLTSASDVQYHRLKEGSGGEVLQDYELHEYLVHLKSMRIREINDNTEAIFMARGYEWDKGEAGKYMVACHQTARDDLDSFATLDLRLGEAMPYPAAFPGKEDGIAVPVLNATELTQLCAGLGVFVMGIKMTGETLKASIKSATTKAQIDAIIDER